MSKRALDFIVGVPLLAFFSLFKKKEPADVSFKKILVIKLAAVGDTILLMPALQSLRDAFPQARIDWMVSSVNMSVATMVKSVDGFVAWEGMSPFSLIALIKKLREEKYDAVVDLEQWARGTALISYFSGAPVRAGFDTPGQHRAGLYTRSHGKRYDQHELKEFYAVLRLLGPVRENAALGLIPGEDGKFEIAQKMPELRNKEKGRRVLFHPGCGADGAPREWPLPNYAVLGHWIQKNFDASLILTSGPEETGKTKKLRKLLNNEVIDMGGKLSWRGLIALVDQMDLVVSGNTGVMHIAAALGKKQIALHGPTDPVIWGPLNSHAAVIQSPCPQCPCLRLGFEYHSHDQSCMALIEVEDVKKAVSALFDNKSEI